MLSCRPSRALVLAASLLVTSCASSSNPNDPYESYNRKIYNFNMMMDHYVLRPITVGYVTYIPEPVRYVITNFYNNLRDFVSLGDDILQLDGMNSMQTTMRIGINTTFGLLGMIDVASSLGLPQYKNTFSNTMKRWGWINSSYFLVPFFGPGTLRDQLGLVPDVWFNPTWYIINDYWVSGGLFVINQIDVRSKYLGQDQLLEQALDPYATIRDIYLQHYGEYIYPSPTNESSTVSDDVDALIADGNAPPTANSDSLDALIADENAKLPPLAKAPQTPVTSPAQSRITPNSAASAPKITPATTVESTTSNESIPTTESSTLPTPDGLPTSPRRKTNLRTFDGKIIYAD